MKENAQFCATDVRVIFNAASPLTVECFVITLLLSPKEENQMDQTQFVSELAKLHPASTFLSLKGYRNEASEVANYSLVFHMSYQSALQKSIAVLQDLSLSGDLEKQAREELVASFTNSLIKIWETPIEEIGDGYTRFFDESGNYIKGVKLHIETNTLHLYGLVSQKRVLMPGFYKTKNSRPLTIAKDKLRYLTPCGKFRQFKITPYNVDRISVQNLSLLPPT